MAAPEGLTMRTFSGDWVPNMSMSGDYDAVLQVQNVGWVLRKTMLSMTMTQKITVKTDPASGSPVFDIVSSAKLGSTQEDRIVDWVERERDGGIFGKLKVKTRFISIGALRAEATILGGEPGVWSDGDDFELLHSVIANEKEGWSYDQIWGFMTKNGERRHARRIRAENNKGKTALADIIYDFVPAK